MVDYSSLDPLKTTAGNATNNYASMVESAPSLLQNLQKNLTTIFATDNPIVNARSNSLATYLSTPSQARADLLTPNLPNVAGSPLTLSPTQQDAIVQGRTAAAFAPLAGLNQAVTGIYGNIPQIVNNAGSIYSSLLGGEKTKADLANQAYDRAFQELTQKENFRQQELSRLLTSGRGGTAAGQTEGVLNQIASDASRGLTLDQIMKKYSTSAYVNPADVLRIYNTNSTYGTAKETPQDLLQRYGVTPNISNDQLNRQTALGPAQNAISEINKLDLSKTGPGNRVAQFSLQYLGGTGVPQNLVSLNQGFELLKQNVVRALQGARMSDQDIKIAQNYIPSIIDTPATVRTKLDNLEKYINNLQGKSSTSTNSGGWEIVQ